MVVTQSTHQPTQDERAGEWAAKWYGNGLYRLSDAETYSGEQSAPDDEHDTPSSAGKGIRDE